MLELKHISFEVPEDGVDKEIIKDISFVIPDGKFTVITGPNGGGKSTLAKLIAGIQKPTSGQILWDGTHHIIHIYQCKFLSISGCQYSHEQKKGYNNLFHISIFLVLNCIHTFLTI